MGYQNNFRIDQIDEFTTDITTVADALDGKYAKYKGTNYKLTILRDLCFINTFGDCSIDIPSHYIFKFTDDAGEHLINEGINNLTVKGVTSFNFSLK